MSVPRRFVEICLAIVAILPYLVQAQCECGYTTESGGYVFTDLVETDFTTVADISESSDWMRPEFVKSSQQARGPFGEQFSKQNVATLPKSNPDGKYTGLSVKSTDPGLQLLVGGSLRNGLVQVAEIDSARDDFKYGSYRASMRLTKTNGTCAAFFWYFNDTQEIDLEFLSREFDPVNKIFPVNLVLQSRESLAAGFNAQSTNNFVKANLSFDPTTGFHEYRIDYLPTKVIFYADDQVLAQMEGTAVPTEAGHLILQHWSNGNTLWSGGPPAQDAIITVEYVKLLFNSSSPQRQDESARRCSDASPPVAICTISARKPANDPNSGDSAGSGMGGKNGGSFVVGHVAWLPLVAGLFVTFLASRVSS